MKIEDLTGFRPGDIVTVTHVTNSGRSATVTGEVWEDSSGDLRLVPSCCGTAMEP